MIEYVTGEGALQTPAHQGLVQGHLQCLQEKQSREVARLDWIGMEVAQH